MRYFLTLLFISICIWSCSKTEKVNQDKPNTQVKDSLTKTDIKNFISHSESGFSTILPGEKVVEIINDTLKNGNIYSETTYESQINNSSYSVIIIDFKNALDNYIVNEYADQVANNMSCSNAIKKDTTINKRPCINYSFSECGVKDKNGETFLFREGDFLIILTIDYFNNEGFDEEVLESIIL